MTPDAAPAKLPAAVEDAASATLENQLAGGLPPGGRRTAPKQHPWRRRLLWIGAGLILIVALAIWAGTRKPAPLPGPVIAESGAATVRAEVRPAKRATLAAINPGEVDAVFVDAGQTVESRAPIARIQGPAGAEMIFAPWRGTVTTLQVHLGDTVLSGAVIATIADLGHLQVETLDVDEFQVAKMKPGQTVTVTIDALNQTVPGRIRTVALEPQLNSTGDSNYLVVIDLTSRLPDLRSGMSARVRV